MGLGAEPVLEERHRGAGDIALIFGKRPAEELYDLRNDPHQLTNVADKPEYADALKQLRARVDEWMKQTARNLTDGTVGFLTGCRYLLHDRASVISEGWA